MMEQVAKFFFFNLETTLNNWKYFITSEAIKNLEENDTRNSNLH